MGVQLPVGGTYFRREDLVTGSILPATSRADLRFSISEAYASSNPGSDASFSYSILGQALELANATFAELAAKCDIRRAQIAASDGKLAALQNARKRLIYSVRSSLIDLKHEERDKLLAKAARKPIANTNIQPIDFDCNGTTWEISGWWREEMSTLCAGITSISYKIKANKFTLTDPRSRRRTVLRAAFGLVDYAEAQMDDITSDRDTIVAALNQEMAGLHDTIVKVFQDAALKLSARLDEKLLVASYVWDAARWRGWVPPTEVLPINVGAVGFSSGYGGSPTLQPQNLASPSDQGLPDHEGWGPLAMTVGLREPSVEEFGIREDLFCSFIVDHRNLGPVLISQTSDTRAHTLSKARSMIARLLAAIPPGQARFTFFDPLGLGESVAPFLALGDHDQKLIDGKAWSSSADLRERLNEYVAHIERVIQKYLRGEYRTIEDFNAAAGEIAEPYRFLVIFDFPSQFDQESLHLINRIIENGPRCGVYPIVIADDVARENPSDINIEDLPRSMTLLYERPRFSINSEGMTVATQLWLSGDPIDALGRDEGQAIIDVIVDGVGREGRGADDVVVGLGRALELYSTMADSAVRADIPVGAAGADLKEPQTWWRNSTSEAVLAPLGQSGAREVALLRFDSEVRAGGILVGRPGSGKSTLLHTYIGGLCTLYSPAELELYLIDFREGVEFKAYGELGLPQARCVAVDTEREFGVSVLDSIVDEMQRRSGLIKGSGGEWTTFSGLRTELDEPLPRIVLVFDEFHVLFENNDKVGAKAADLLETIIRQGRGFGVHVILGSQSLSGMEALERHVLNLLSVRIVLPSAEADATMLLGDGNNAWKMLSRRGEGVLNPKGGAIEANVPFQTAFESEDARVERLRKLRKHADELGFDRRPVVFEGFAAASIEESEPSDFVAAGTGTSEWMITLRAGKPMSLGSPVDVVLRRQGGANVLFVGRDSHDVPLATVTAMLTSAVVVERAPLVEFIDLTPIDEGVEDLLEPFDAVDGFVLTRRRGAAGRYEQLANRVRQRMEEDESRAQAILLVVFGLQRARDFDDSAPSDSEEGTSPSPMENLRTILIDGPEVGVHTIVWADSMNTVGRRLPRELVNEFGFRIAGQMSRDDSQDLIDVDAAATLKDFQVVVVNDDDGTVQRATSYARPSITWLNRVLASRKEA